MNLKRLASSTELARMAWSRPKVGLSRKRRVSLGAILSVAQRKLGHLLEKGSFPFKHRPRLPRPISSPGSLRPARPFSRGALENDRKRNPEPIPYLLTETHETTSPKPVPWQFFRSLAKGKGVLRRNSRGLVYLDIDNRFILALIPGLKNYGLVRPPYFNLFGTPEGAHIPVIPAREAAFHYLDAIREIDREFSFEIEGLYSVEPTLWPEVEQVWFFKVHSESLEALRRRYFLLERPGGHSFHIAIAVKARPTAAIQPQPLPIMRINVGYLAA